MFCSDDKIPAELLESGYINDMIRIAVSEGGVSVANALQMATINTARHYNRKDVGAILPGRKADLLVLDSLCSYISAQRGPETVERMDQVNAQLSRHRYPR